MDTDVVKPISDPYPDRLNPYTHIVCH